MLWVRRRAVPAAAGTALQGNATSPRCWRLAQPRDSLGSARRAKAANAATATAGDACCTSWGAGVQSAKSPLPPASSAKRANAAVEHGKNGFAGGDDAAWANLAAYARVAPRAAPRQAKRARLAGMRKMHDQEESGCTIAVRVGAELLGCCKPRRHACRVVKVPQA